MFQHSCVCDLSRGRYKGVKVSGKGCNKLSRPGGEVASKCKGSIDFCQDMSTRKMVYSRRRGVLARSSPRQAISSCLSRTRSLEICRLWFLVFQPGAGPAAACVEPNFLAVLVLFHVVSLELNSAGGAYSVRRPRLRVFGQCAHDFSKNGLVTPRRRPAFGGSLFTNDE